MDTQSESGLSIEDFASPGLLDTNSEESGASVTFRSGK